MDVNNRGLHHPATRMGPQDLVYSRERIAVGLFHKHLPQRLGHKHLAATLGIENAKPFAWHIATGIVQRADNARLGLNKLQHVLLVKGVITQCDTVRASVQQRFCMRARQPHAVGSVFAIHDNKVQ
eukprot:CAMPEP_0184466992 /NCGR_PEP_ID=MMETSP0740-20130409/69234_1 /TAXON_ID=385413 /ORGANISM="Thalassiosira miniscula, Strain CCMP1093" /LENGTH=125 /DNA_ID=CAMNT_0026842203 /DNA_START=53 /DNA_END=427 /DNA_ORIENTATION=+